MTEGIPAGTILCVEDEEALREELCEELSSMGYAVHGAADCAEAQALLSGVRPDVILCDVMIPDMSGFDFLRRLRDDGKLPRTTAFIFMTALSSRDMRLEGLNSGADDYLTKPVDLDLLHLKIRNRLDFVRRVQSSGAAPITAHLSPREEQVLTHLGLGARTTAIAHALSISEYTVNQYIKDIYRKLGISNRADAARAAIRIGLVRPDQMG
ncbi:response regulator transcription factor [Paenirhodobacter sp.]|uniref:response regulator transcription factor n=1 Tax=Paenirhodobacter sp. TaxID=1965326 RepID=UPI003B41F37A